MKSWILRPTTVLAWPFAVCAQDDSGWLARAAQNPAYVGAGGNVPEDAAYPIARFDADGRPLNGGSRYVLRFTKADIPTFRRSPLGADKQSNWLPVPDGEFILMLRLYWPKDEVISGTWAPPPVRRQP